MREILFRGKRKDNGEWVEGRLLADDVIVPCGQDFILEANCLYAGDKPIIGYKVYKKTVGQFTGLPDKNRKKIFEGDILKTSNSNCCIWYVDYKNSAFCANQANANYACELSEFISTEEVEVIGNIHDNPELL